eukprot:scaffold291126_cov19-Prasinocladus_malaysianus.AAC.1
MSDDALITSIARRQNAGRLLLRFERTSTRPADTTLAHPLAGNSFEKGRRSWKSNILRLSLLRTFRLRQVSFASYFMWPMASLYYEYSEIGRQTRIASLSISQY